MLPFRSGRSWKRGASALFFVVGMLGAVGAVAGPKKTPAETASKSKNPIAPGSIPLPIGHEAKGLVLPDFNAQGQLQARIEAAVAKRIDADRVEFTGVKVTTYTPQNTRDLAIDMPSSTLDLNTRVILYHERTTVTRADFTIAGHNMSFDTM